MKKQILILSMLALISCNNTQEEKKELKTIEVKKIVIGKTQQLDSYYNIFTGKQVTQTLFTIAYNDGSEENVNFAQYAKVKEGDNVFGLGAVCVGLWEDNCAKVLLCWCVSLCAGQLNF